MKAGDNVWLIPEKTKGTVTETRFSMVKVRFKNTNAEFHESTWWFDNSSVRKVEKQDV